MANVMEMLTQLKANPMSIVTRRWNVPPNITNPNSIIQYLLNSGQISQDALNKAYQMAQRLK